MALSRHLIHDDQDRHSAAPTELDHLIECTVGRTLTQLADRPLPVMARLLRAEAAARYCGVDPDTLRDWRKGGTGPRFKKIGTRVAYTVEELDRWIDALPSYSS